jgi:hypothetical protein
MTSAPLTLEGLELQHFTEKVHVGLINSIEAPLRLGHCRLLLRTRPDGVTALFAGNCPLLEARNCLFTSDQSRTVVDWRPATGGRMLLEDCLISNHNGGVFVIPNGRDMTGVTVRLARNTIVGASPMALYFDETMAAAAARPHGPIAWEATDNVFDGDRLLTMGRILSQTEPIDFQAGQKMLRQRLTWRDQRNVYGVAEHYLRVTHNDLGADGLKTLANWLSLWEAGDSGSLAGWPRFQSARLNAHDHTRPEELRAADFRLLPGSPGQGAGDDGRDLGADVNQVGPGTAYDAWRKTPEYEEWVNGQR